MSHHYPVATFNSTWHLALSTWHLAVPVYPFHRLKSTLAFTPPNPKPFDIANSIAIGRAAPATMSTPSAAESGSSRFSVAGAIWSRSARAVKMASTPPAAPSRWPIADFVDVTTIFDPRPKTPLIASSSPLSPTGVEVACDLVDYFRLLTQEKYSELKFEEFRVVLLEIGPRILPELGERHPKLVAYAEKEVARLRIDIADPDDLALQIPCEIARSEHEFSAGTCRFARCGAV